MVIYGVYHNSNPATIVNTTGFEPNVIIPENNTQDSIVYTLILTAITDNGCQDTDTNIVTVYLVLPLASAIPSAIDSCGPFVVNFNNISTPYNQEDITSMNFEWYVDGVLINTTLNLYIHLIAQHLTILHTWLNYTLHHNMIALMIPALQLLYILTQ